MAFLVQVLLRLWRRHAGAPVPSADRGARQRHRLRLGDSHGLGHAEHVVMVGAGASRRAASLPRTSSFVVTISSKCIYAWFRSSPATNKQGLAAPVAVRFASSIMLILPICDRRRRSMWVQMPVWWVLSSSDEIDVCVCSRWLPARPLSLPISPFSCTCLGGYLAYLAPIFHVMATCVHTLRRIDFTQVLPHLSIDEALCSLLVLRF